MSNRGAYIPRGREDERKLESAIEIAFEEIKNDYLFNIPSNWGIELGKSNIKFSDIKESAIKMGYPSSNIEKYYDGNNSIVTDGRIIYLSIKKDNDVYRFPLFIGEMKKQGTNDKRMKEGKSKQAQGNAAGDRVAKNYSIASDYCYICDNEFFPYTVFLHGFDFSESEITSTTKSKLKPFFGELNKFNPWFDKNTISKKGGTCLYQEKDFTTDYLKNICYKCCKTGIEHYLKKFA